MSIKFITSIYSDLYGTEYGGRVNRGGHYRYSLLSLLKMTDADFLCYTSDRELDSLIEFFYNENNISPEKLKFQVFDISQTKFKDLINQYKNIDETKPSPLAKELFNFPYVKEVFIDENYISVTKYEVNDWNQITLELRSFIKLFIENGGTVLDESLIENTEKLEKQQISNFDNLDTTSQQIINILEEYVKPAVAADGGNILFDSYDETEKRVKVVLQGACNGCPSSTFTLKSGIENMLKDMLNDENIKVEAING